MCYLVLECPGRPERHRHCEEPGFVPRLPNLRIPITANRLPFQPRVLLLDHTLIQLFEQGRRRTQGLPVVLDEAQKLPTDQR
jgi:hypothetical protein